MIVWNLLWIAAWTFLLLGSQVSRLAQFEILFHVQIYSVWLLMLTFLQQLYQWIFAQVPVKSKTKLFRTKNKCILEDFCVKITKRQMFRKFWKGGMMTDQPKIIRPFFGKVKIFTAVLHIFQNNMYIECQFSIKTV